MNSASRRDRLRAAKLAGAVLAVFIFAAWRVTGAMAETLPSGPRRVVAIGGDRSTVADPETASRAAKLTLLDRNDDSDAAIDPEPFRPLTVGTVGTVEAVPPVRPAAAETFSPMPPALGGPLAPLPDAGISGAVAPGSEPAMAAGPGTLPEARLSMQLTGVVVGARPTAVIMVGDAEIVVRPGSRLPDGSTLTRIDATSVTLVREGRTSVLWVAD